MPDRMPRIPPEKMSVAQQKAAAELAAGPRGAVNWPSGKPAGWRGPFVAMMRSPELMDRTQKLGEYVRFHHCGLDPRIKTLASLMTSRHWTNQYEWHGQRGDALKAGLNPAIIDAIAEGRRPTSMADDEEIVHDFMTELIANKSVSDATYARTVAKFGEQGVINLLGVAGYYTMLAMIMNVVRTPVPDGKPFELAPMPQQIRPNT
ncbi:MAG: carboxymuconolactone decarboxylase family protein [Betaproteobacteria bacterium]|nr:carboxymuconolactone decarboxylase family protein [Betaproteobacteria bacterium]